MIQFKFRQEVTELLFTELNSIMDLNDLLIVKQLGLHSPNKIEQIDIKIRELALKFDIPIEQIKAPL